MSQDTIDLLRTAGFLHDLGKIALPDHILKSPDYPSEREWEQIRLHPRHGATTLEDVEGFEDVSEIILYHHEQPNGSGYPVGLRGEEIPFYSRIITIADVFSATISERHYKEAYPIDDAVKYTLYSDKVHISDKHSLVIEDLLKQIVVKSDGEQKSLPQYGHAH